MKILVGHTGFVGSNLNSATKFDLVFNSRNIEDAFGLQPDVLYYSGVRAEKFLANKEPEKDFEIILNAIENIKKINPKKIVLISTVDVYPNPVDVDELSEIDESSLQPYGKNRLYLEKWIENHIASHLIVRLPGLFGQNIKKNFIYDLIQIVPAMLNEELFMKFSESQQIKNSYTKQENGFYKLNALDKNSFDQLKNEFFKLNFTALNFTDSRGKFQFYNLANLYNDCQTALENNIKKLNLATEPVGVSEIYEALYHKKFENELKNPVPNYNFKTLYAKVFNQQSHYLYTKEQTVAEIISFIKNQNE